MDFIQELSNKKVLSKDDIISLKQYISKRYIDYSDAEKSDVLVKAIHQVLDNNMQGLKKEYNQILKQDLLKKIILENGQTIWQIDILNTCISSKDKSNDFFESIMNWINFHVENKVSKEELENYNLKVNAPEEEYFIRIPNPEPLEYVVLNRYISKESFINLKGIVLLVCFFIILLIVSSNNLKTNRHLEYQNLSSDGDIVSVLSKEFISNVEPYPSHNIKVISNLPAYLKYKDINQILLKSFLLAQNSILVEEPYFSTIVSISKKYDINPFVLFAITGQEENFVPKENVSSRKMANNPFNVYHSWKEYNTNIEDASRIVCVTIINLCKDRPEAEEAFKWINRKYAEDKNWFKGVYEIYNKLEKNNIGK